jgi:CHAT domain-containing protein/tetratricopeptide (TPR) repeat protein
MSKRAPVIVCVLHLMAMVDAARGGDAPPPDPFAPCRAQFADKPDDYESASCFSRLALDEALWSKSRRAFEALIAGHPENFWLRLAYGNAWAARDPDRAEALYRQAAEGFRVSGHAEGELLARSTLRNFLFPRGRVEEAAREAGRGIAIGDASRDPLVKAAAWSLQALHLQDSGADLGHALRLLKQAETAIFPDGPYRLKRANLISLGQVASRLGRLDEALAIYARLDALATSQANAQDQAVARFNLFNTTAMKENLLPTPRGRETLMQLVQRALEAGEAAPHELVVIRSHAALAELFSRSDSGRSTALEHAKECLRLASRSRRPHDEAFCAWIEAAIRQSDNPGMARAAEMRALDATARANNPRTDAYSAGRRMRHSWSTRPRAIALQDSLAAIDTLETLRALQEASDTSAALFSAWTLDYYWLSGRLIEDGGDDDVALAFSLTERMRARSLLDVIDRSRPTPDPGHAAVKERKAALEAIATVQRTLMDPTLGGERRRALLTELERHENREREGQRQISLAFPRYARPEFASLGALQASLAEQEAFLSFQVGLWKTYEGDQGGGAWLLVVTKDRTTVHRLPDRTRLDPVIPVFVGLIRANEGREVAAAVRLHEELLGKALSSLPARITRLIIAPDGSLHHLPFESLRATALSPPLGALYELVYAPSATLWRHWRANARTPTDGRVLTFADPAVEGSVGTESSRNAAYLQGLRLGRLPHARQESRAIERHIATTRALVGSAASERALKSADLTAYDIVHFAAHAVADESHPERSAIFLVSGDAREDGLLQGREIGALDLAGRIVVLSACQTASGAVQSGEGVLSLARAFFEAGAHAVIGSRWPLRDADGAALFETFYRQLAAGASLAEALKTTQHEARAAGLPASAWAGLVLLGNGDLRPFPHGQPPGRMMGGSVGALAVTAVVVLVFAVVRLRGREGRRRRVVA